MSELLAALLVFNAAVTEARGILAPSARVFVGAQAGDGDNGYAWTKCVPESGVFIVQVAEKTLKLPPEKIRFAAAHEVCHVALHGRMVCRAAGAAEEQHGFYRTRKQEMENEADDCAVRYMFGGGE